ncbi:MFS transporter [Actinokineospora globicatena]|uniref:MFS transporter n=1 Tax=Actinokineospora globicatena TaxID=103729 RepID=A0A9W6V8K3_9PSEU|nr:MFS transporter [Actinokineospora globicatena]MCP2303449.1 drug resistance transporter, EmrB/QacA subfamily [Actinokineospora globicatena]GLW79417.1 MFS transporter [Actinokineospora globicatena]GLW86173.1 MFS transporter [Actinokineospora globicatena]GLW90033.1 MFS transporter [Actinokineospora globicatena]
MALPTNAARVSNPALALAALAIAQLTIGLDYNIVFVALPDISTIGFDPHQLQWTISAYTVAFGGFLLLGGRCADLLGRRRVFYTGLTLYAVGSLLGGLAQSPAILLAARAVQGLGGAVLAPATLSLITTAFAEGPQRNRALGIWGAAGSSGMVLGSLLGGVLTEWLGWRAVFFVNLPIVVVVALLAAASIPRDTGASLSLRSFDIPGAVTITAASTLLVLGLVQGPAVGWQAPVTVISLVAAAVLVAVFAVIESRTREPLIPLTVLRFRNLGLGAGIAFAFMATVGALPYFLTTILQDVYDYTAFETGLAFILPCACVLVGTVLGGKLASTIGLRVTLTASTVVAGAGIVLFAALLSVDGSFLSLVPGIVVFSLTQGIIFTAMYAAATSGLPDEQQGLASGVASSGQQIGGAVGLAVLVAVSGAAAAGQNPDVDVVDGARAASYVAAVIIAAAALLGAALRIKRVPDVVPAAPVDAAERSTETTPS